MSPRKKRYNKPGRPKNPPKPVPIQLAVQQSERLIMALKLRKILPAHLATLSGIKKGTILRIKDPKSRQVGALTNTLFEIAQALKINPGWLAYGDEYCEMLPAKKISPNDKS